MTKVQVQTIIVAVPQVKTTTDTTMVFLPRASRSVFIASYRQSRHRLPRSWLSTAISETSAATEGIEATTTSQEGGDNSSFHPTDVEYSFAPIPPLSAVSLEKVDKLFQHILSLDMIEVHLLTQLVHTKMGGHWQDLAGMGSGGVGGTAGRTASRGDAEDATDDPAQAASQNKDVKLVGFDPKNKIKVIKEVRAIAGLGLKEAKELVEVCCNWRWYVWWVSFRLLTRR